MANLPRIFQKVDRRLARIDRQLGILTARLYFKPANSTDYAEVDIFGHEDKGLTPKNWRTGVEMSAYRHTCKVARDWMVAQTGVTGTYALRLTPDADLLPCEVESQLLKEGDTHATLDLRVIQPVTAHTPISFS